MTLDEHLSVWAAERLAHGPLSMDGPASEQVIDAVADLRKSFAASAPKDAPAALDKWFDDSFMNKPPLTHNIPAVNQVKAAITDLKARLAADAPPAAPILPLRQPPPAAPAEIKE